MTDKEYVDGVPLKAIISWHESIDEDEAVGKWKDKLEKQYGTTDIKELDEKYIKSKSDKIS